MEFVCLYHEYEGVEVQLHAFVTAILDEDGQLHVLTALPLGTDAADY
jgi:hypothetical protein